MSAAGDPATCAALHEFRLRHVHLSLRVDMAARAIAGVAELRLQRLDATGAVRSLRLDVFRLRVFSVKAEVPPTENEDGEEEEEEATLAPVEWRVLPFTAFGEALEIVLPDALATPETAALRLVVEYETQLDSPGVCWLDAQQTAGKQLPYMYTQGQEVLNRSLFPCQDSPSVRITYSASVVVPERFVCVMSARHGGDQPELDDQGRVTGRRFSFEMTQSIPVYLVAMAVGDLVAADIGPRSKVWTEPCMLEAATKEFDGIVERYITIGEQLFGEYQWEQYDVLVMPPSFPYGGMENPRLTFVSPCNVAGDQSLVSVIAHEISHSWFGNLVTNASWSDFFLNEGFTMYAERRITEVAHGRSLMCLNAKLGEALLREEISSLGEDSPLTRLRVPLEQGIDPGDCYNHCAYEKGYDFVCYLRKLAGSDEAFDEFLRHYCERFRFQSIPAEDMMAFFLEYFPHHADKSELKGDISFHEWLHAPGYPRFVPDLSDAQDVMESCETLAFYWRSSPAPVQANVLYLTEEAKSWEVFQLLYFLDCCFDATFAGSEVVIALGDALSLWTSTNSEVRFRWAQVLIKNAVLSKLDVVRAFLKAQGKQKFQIPLFRLLTGSAHPAVRQLAVDTFAESKLVLHVMVRDRIEALLDATVDN